MNINDNRGYLYIETLIMIAIVGIIFASGAVIGRQFLANTMAEYEAIKLISSLRYVQELNRNSYFVRDEEFKKIEPGKSTLFKVAVNDYFYEIKASSNKFEPKIYYAMNNVNYWKTSTFNNGITFDISGNPKIFGSVRVKAKFGEKMFYRYVIIDKAGRIRLDRTSE